MFIVRARLAAYWLPMASLIAFFGLTTHAIAEDLLENALNAHDAAMRSIVASGEGRLAVALSQYRPGAQLRDHFQDSAHVDEEQAQKVFSAAGFNPTRGSFRAQYHW